jgi:stage II sporulation protein AA (anti-sigma F factor antagonist)
VEQLEVDIDERDGLIRIELRGELDLATAPQVEEALEGAESGEPPLIALDLSQLSFLDSSGLRTIVAADGRAREAGRRLTVVKGPEAVQRVFTITGLEDRLELVEDASALPAGE